MTRAEQRPTPAVVAGTDGTGSSRAAVRWAAREARRRRLPLRIVHTYEEDWHPARATVGTVRTDVVRSAAEAVAAAAYAQAHEAAPEIGIRSDAIEGRAADRLLDEAGTAELLVVGNRGRGGFAGLLLGSVSARVATHARCPVVVVRDGADEPAGPVLAGVDDSPFTEVVLETAFRAAAGRGSALVAVRAVPPVLPLRLTGLRPAGPGPPDPDAAGEVALRERLAPWRATYPGVAAGTVLTHDSAAGTLVAASRTAQLVVVGSGAHGVVAGTLLGSTSLQVLHHSHCPVQVVRRR